MTRTAHLLPHDGVGGVETAARGMASASAADQFRLFLIAGPSVLATDTVIPSAHRSPLNPVAWFSAARKIVQFQPDALIFSLWKSVPTALLAKLMRPRMRLAYTLNVADSPHLLDRVMTIAALGFADEAWSDSDATERLRKPHWIAGRRLNFIGAGLTPVTAPTPTPRFVSWCRLHHQKGLDRAIQLVALLRNSGLPATFDIYGPDSGAEEELRTLAVKHGVSDAVHFHGAATPAEIPAIASSYSFFLLPSRYEGMAMATVEAMQLGLVPVVTAVGEMGQYVRDDQNGLIIDPDHLDNVADRLRRLLPDADRYAAMREAAIGQWANVPSYRESVARAIEGLLAS